jgi:glycosyltransferase involved in cell wall biosynthesis
MPRVSIITPTYNAAKYLPAAIDSVLGQTCTDWELIIVDDGSTDNTRSLVASYLPILGEKLRYLYQSNRGQSAARNAGLQVAKSEFVATLDADDLWLPTRLARGLAIMDRCSHVGLVHSKVARVDIHGDIVGYFDFPAKYQAGKIAVNIYDRRANILSPTVLLRRQCLEVVGFFDETLAATEDRDLWFRIAERYEVAYIDEILAHLRRTPGSASSDASRVLKAQLSFVRKHYERGACGRAARRRALGQIYREQGDAWFSSGQLNTSIDYYSRSVFCNPMNVENLYMLLRACAEPFLGSFQTMRTVKGDEGKLG